MFGIEQLGVNPNPYRKNVVNYEETHKGDPKAKLLDDFYSYNRLNRWNYEQITQLVGGGIGKTAKTVGELREVMRFVLEHPDDLIVVNVEVPINDSPL